MYVNKELKHKRRTDLEDSRIEAVWLEVCPLNRIDLFFLLGLSQACLFEGG